MTFCIVSVGWECADFLDRTLASVDAQTLSDYRVMIIDDASLDTRQEWKIEQWCERRDHWQYRINRTHRGPVFNQHEAIWLLEPDDDDVVVWLDLDGDQFADAYVLETLSGLYADDTQLTYGNYYPVPDHGTCPPAIPFPAHVVASNTYRTEVLATGSHFNHLRTMKGRIAKAITPELLSWPGGEWYEAGADYLYMIMGLELAGGRYKCFDEHLCIYNNANPHADWIEHPELTNRCVLDFLRRPALEPL